MTKTARQYPLCHFGFFVPIPRRSPQARPNTSNALPISSLVLKQCGDSLIAPSRNE